MNENNKENSKEKIEGPVINNVDKDKILNFANNLMKNENTIDINSVMRMATNLLKDDSLMNTVKDIGQFKQSPIPKLPKVPETVHNTELTSIKEQVESIVDGLTEVKRELIEVKEQNRNLIELILQVQNGYKRNK